MKVLLAALGALSLLGIWGLPTAAAPPVTLDEIKIAVNNKALTRREVEQFRGLQAQELRRQHEGEELENRLRALDTELPELLVQDLLIESHAERLRIEVSDKEIEERVDAIVRRQPGLTDAYTDEQLKAFVLKDLLRRRVLARELDAHIHVTRAEVVAACRRQSQDSREVDVGHILVRGDEEEARRKLADLRQRILAGADFEQLAAQNSEDPSVASNRGRLGFISRGQFVKPFEDAAFALTVGQVSEPVQTRFGLHLIKVFEERSRNRINCEQLDDVTRQSLENQVYAQSRQERLDAFLVRLKQHADIRVFD